jgi:hypothetical protein
MKLIKMFGLAMVGALAVMAFIGTGTASAELCKTNTSPCTSPWNTPTTVLISSPEIKLSSSFATFPCESHATLVHEGEKNGKLFGSISLLDWTNCKIACIVTTTTNGTFEDEAAGGGNGKLYPLNIVVLLKNCPLGAECTYSATNGTTSLNLDGGTINGTALDLANTSVTVKGFGCGSTATLKTEKPYVVLLVSDSTGDYTSGSIFQE